MEPHPFYQAIIDAYREANRPAFHQVSAQEARAMMRAVTEAAKMPPDLPQLRAVEDREIAGPHGPIPVRVYHPLGQPVGTMAYFHSGGWVIGDLDSADVSCRRLAAGAGCTLVSVNYRKAPEHPFPQPLDDCWAAMLWAHDAFPGPLLVGGESAGGNLAAACAIKARDAGGPPLVGQWLAYPVTDHDFETPSYNAVGDMGFLLSRADMQWFWGHYCPPGTDRTNPLASPLHVPDASGLPPAMVLVAQLDPLRDEGLAFAHKLGAAGVPVVSRCEAGVVHGFLNSAHVIPAVAEAFADTARWMKARFAG